MRKRRLWLLFCMMLACGDGGREGETCEGPADCDGLECVAVLDPHAADLEPLALTCGEARTGREPGQPCQHGGQCASHICLLAGTCAPACAGPDDCSKRERCQAVYARGSRGRLHPVHACVAMVDLGGAATVRVETRKAAWSGGEDELILTPATEDDTLFVIEHLDDDTWPVPSPDTSCRPALCAESLEPNTPDGERWFDRSELSAPSGPINPIALGDHVYPLTVRVPAGPRAQPGAESYTLRVTTKRPGRARITQLARSPRSGQLDLNLYYAGTSAAPDAVARALEEIDRLFEPAEIFVGERREIRVTGELLERGSELPNAEASRGFARLRLQYRVYPQLPELFKLSAGAGNRALDVFLVDVIEGSDVNVGGFAGGTPVPFGMHGTGASGVVLATAGLETEPEELGRRLAHEIGHALGLFHTVETNGDVLDPLPDTPADAAGETNLMYPVTRASAIELTPDQVDVLQRAPLLD